MGKNGDEITKEVIQENFLDLNDVTSLKIPLNA